VFGIDGKKIETIEDATIEICAQLQATLARVNAILDAIADKFNIKVPPPPGNS
jgi:hypothetical protein